MSAFIAWIAKQAAALAQSSTSIRVDHQGKGARKTQRALHASRASNSQPPYAYGQKVNRPNASPPRPPLDPADNDSD